MIKAALAKNGAIAHNQRKFPTHGDFFIAHLATTGSRGGIIVLVGAIGVWY
jgi:hypothetical protein